MIIIVIFQFSLVCQFEVAHLHLSVISFGESHDTRPLAYQYVQRAVETRAFLIVACVEETSVQVRRKL